MTLAADGVPSLLCRVGQAMCAFPLEHVIETMRPLPVEPLAGAPVFVMGLSIIRGGAIVVVAMSRLLGESDSRKPSRFVTVRVGERRVALAVDSVIGVRRMAPDSIAELPPLLKDASADLVTAVGVLDSELTFVLETARIVPGSVLDAVDPS